MMTPPTPLFLKSVSAMAMQRAVTSLSGRGSPRMESAEVSVTTVSITLRAAGVNAAVTVTIATGPCPLSLPTPAHVRVY